jgi:hypothetical protein
MAAPALSLQVPALCLGCLPLLPRPQREAAELLLELGADPNQVLPAHINGGAYPMWSDSYSAEEVGRRRLLKPHAQATV